MDFEPQLDDEFEENGLNDDTSELLDLEALVKKARRSHEIEESDVQAILATADEVQAEKLYDRLQKMGIRVISATGKTVDAVGESSNVLNQAEEHTLTLKREAQALRTQKQALMQQLLTGKRRVQIDDMTQASA